MGLSFSSLFNSLSALLKKEKDVRILMLGLDSAGKTTILYRLQVSLGCSGPRVDANYLTLQIGEVVATVPSELFNRIINRLKLIIRSNWI